VELSDGENRHSATLLEISRTGAKVAGIIGVTAGQELEFRAGTVRVPGEVVWSEGAECAIAFGIPIAAAEVSRLRSLAAFVSGMASNND